MQLSRNFSAFVVEATADRRRGNDHDVHDEPKVDLSKRSSCNGSVSPELA